MVFQITFLNSGGSPSIYLYGGFGDMAHASRYAHRAIAMAGGFKLAAAEIHSCTPRDGLHVVKAIALAPEEFLRAS